MAFCMAKPVQIRGLWYFRRRVPSDIIRLVGGQATVKRCLGRGTKAEIESRYHAAAKEYSDYWSNLRTGVRTLTPEQCHALAGEMYREAMQGAGGGRGWAGAPMTWSIIRAACKEAKESATVDMGIKGPMPKLEFLDHFHRKTIEDFLTKRGISVDHGSYMMLLYAVNDATLQAAEVVIRNGQGDFTEDPRADRFPKPERCGLTVNEATRFENLWKEFCKDRNKSDYDARKARHFFDSLIAHVSKDDMAAITENDLLSWRDKLEASGLAQKTVKEGYFAHIKSFFRWAKRKKRLATDPSVDVFVECNGSTKMRGLTDDEAAIILSASLARFSVRISPETAAARRWVPWICAYNGARVNEITQLRGCDVFKKDGIWCVKITPEAGRVKNESSCRDVPLHEHLIEQGFLDFARVRKGQTPLFYSRERTTADFPAIGVGNDLASWVRGLGIKDKLVKPNHGWRHRLKTLARRHGMRMDVVDAIQGHTPATVGGKYGVFEPQAMLMEIEKLPRYEVEPAENVDRRRREVKARLRAAEV
jgi:integrase